MIREEKNHVSSGIGRTNGSWFLRGEASLDRQTGLRVEEQYANHYRRVNEISNDVPPATLDQQYDINLRKWLPSDRKEPVLDLGCGMGHLMFYFQRRGFSVVHGIDVSRSQIEQCHRYGLISAEHVEDSVAFLQSRVGLYGIITSFDVIEHVPDESLIPILTAIYNSLCPGGVFVMRVPNAAGLTAMWSRYMDITHQRLFTEMSARQVLEIAGFRKIHVTREHIAYNARLLGWGFERVRSILYFLVRLIYRIQCPGSVKPTVFTGNLYAIAEKT